MVLDRIGRTICKYPCYVHAMSCEYFLCLYLIENGLEHTDYVIEDMV